MEADGTFHETFEGSDDIEIDPNEYWGTYTLTGNQLHMEVYDPFSHQTSEHDYECTITHEKLTLVEVRYTENELLALHPSPSSDPPSIVGSWVNAGRDDTVTLVFEADGTWRATHSGLKGVPDTDPNEYWGTYTLVGSQLRVVVHDAESDDTSEIDYECTITSEKLTLVSYASTTTAEYTRK